MESRINPCERREQDTQQDSSTPLGEELRATKALSYAR